MSAASDVRVRFAPSPTGYLHVGGLRTLFLNWLYAKKTGGKIILRIEDTDQERSTPEAERLLREDIRALHLFFDEGPDEGGAFGPYRQSERNSIYHDIATKLLEAGHAYYCFHTPEQITEMREAAIKMGQPPHMLDEKIKPLPPAEVEERFKRGEKAGIRFRVPKKDMILKDLVRGEIDFKVGAVGDFFITRSPRGNEKDAGRLGYPVYNFACAVDDHLMNITHVFRGEDHLSNTLKQLFIYDVMGWKVPEFGHISMVLGADRQKLSKRNGDVSVRDYTDRGYLSDALLNFLSLLGWWPSAGTKTKSGHPELISREELVQAFDTSGLQKSAAVFDVQKLNWMNSQYIKAEPIENLAKLARPFFDQSDVSLKGRSDAWFHQLLQVIRGEVDLLSDLPKAAELFFRADAQPEAEAVAVLKEGEAAKVVSNFRAKIEALQGDIQEEQVQALQKQTGLETGAKGKGLFMSIRAAITGRTHGPELKWVLPLLGREEILKRIDKNLKQAGL